MEGDRDWTSPRVVQLRPAPEQEPERSDDERPEPSPDEEPERDSNVIRFDRTEPPNSAA